METNSLNHKKKTHLFKPLYHRLSILVLLILLQNGWNFLLGYLNYKASTKLTQTLLVEREGEHLLNAVIDQERGILEGYDQDNFTFDSSFNGLYELLKDNPSQLQKLDRIKYLYHRWQSEFSLKNIANSTRSDSKEEIALFDFLRNQINSLIVNERKQLRDRTIVVEHLYNINTFINIFSTVGILLGVAFNIQLLHRRAEVPLLELTQVSKLWREGKMEVQFGYSIPNEIGQLAEVLNAMANEINYRQTCIQERNQHLEELIFALSHDLRTPLLATRNILESMLKGAFGAVSDTLREVFEESYQSNEDQIKLVEALLDISRYEVGHSVSLNYEPLNWEKMFVKVITQIQTIAEFHCCLNYKIAQSLPTIYGDELEIRRVLQNLLDNAVRVSDPHKQILIEVASFKDNQVKVSVRDQGIGIEPEKKEQLFHRFIQGGVRRGKCGLGLYLCRQIIAAHGGEIGVESSLGEGSTFWFTLPVNTDQARFHDAQH